MLLFTDLLEKPSNLSTPSKYTVMNGALYLGVGVLMIAWPGMVHTLFRDAPFVGQEGALFRVIGLLLVVVGWLIFSGVVRSASTRRRFCYRPIDIRSAGISPLGVRWGVPSSAGDIRDYRSLAGNWRLGSPQSKGLNGTTASTGLRTN